MSKFEQMPAIPGSFDISDDLLTYQQPHLALFSPKIRLFKFE